MSATTVYLCDELVMPNGQKLWADDIELTVDGYYSIRTESTVYSMARDWDWDFDVEDVAPIIANDEHGDEVRLHLTPDHPAIKALVKKHENTIIQNVIDDLLEVE